MKKRRKFAPEFKAKVALEAVGWRTHDVRARGQAQHHPNLIQQWKRQAQEGLPDLFSGKTNAHHVARDTEVKELHAKIGQLTIEKDFLAKAFGR